MRSILVPSSFPAYTSSGFGRRCYHVIAVYGQNDLLSYASLLLESCYPRRSPSYKANLRAIMALAALHPIPGGCIYKSLSIQRVNKDWHHAEFMAHASPEEKEAWLDSLLTSSSRTTEGVVDVDAFLVVLNAFGNSSESGAPQRAEHWIIRLEKYAQEHASVHQCQPTVPCYQAVMRAWVNATLEERWVAVNRTERWLNAMHLRNLQPTTECYNLLLDVCSNGRGHTNSKNDTMSEQLANKAQQLLDFMLEQYQKYGKDSPVIPNTDSLNFVLRAWTRLRRDEDVAERVVHMLKLFHHARSANASMFIRPNTKSFCMALDALAISARMKAKSCPEQFKSNDSKNGMDEIKYMKNLIDYMHEMYASGVNDVIPNTVAYNTLLSAWARMSGPIHPDAPFEAESILRHMTSLKSQGFTEAFPDSTSYCKVILAWRNSDHSNAGERASWWLRKQWQDYMFTGHPALRPTLNSYNTMIQTWARLGKPLEAEDLLSMLLDFEKKEDEEDLAPDTESFNFVINAWLKAEGNGLYPTGHCLSRALHWLDEAIAREEAGVKTPSVLFLSVLKAARKCSSLGPEILEKVTLVFDKYRASPNPLDFMAYPLLLHVGLDALSKSKYITERNHFVAKLVESCCQDGHVSNHIIRALSNRRAGVGWKSPSLTNEHFPNWPLPPSWSRNVPASYQPTISDTQKSTATSPASPAKYGSTGNFGFHSQ